MTIDRESESLPGEGGVSDVEPRVEHTETHVGDAARGIRNGVLIGAFVWALVLLAIFLL